MTKSMGSALILYYTTETTMELSNTPLYLKTDAIPHLLKWDTPKLLYRYTSNKDSTYWWVPMVYYEDGFDAVQRSMPPVALSQTKPDCCDLRFFFLSANPFGLIDVNTPDRESVVVTDAVPSTNRKRVLNLAYSQEFCKRYIECDNEDIPLRKCEIYLVVPFKLLEEVKESQPWHIQGTLSGFNVETDFHVVGMKRVGLSLNEF